MNSNYSSSNSSSSSISSCDDNDFNNAIANIVLVNQSIEEEKDHII